MSGSQTATIAVPQCSIDIYPFEGGLYSLSPANILSCEVTKDILSIAGDAQILLTPGGPQGIQSGPSWTEIITLRSLVVIAMSRGTRANVTFVGVVDSVQEEQVWEPGARVVRAIRVIARDWAAWFQDFQWAALSVLALTNGQETAFAAGLPPEAGLPAAVLSASEQNGNPAEVGWGWLRNIMGGAGSSQGILSDTVLQYAGSPLPWSTATTAWFASYPIATFPSSYIMISQAGNWESKFREIFGHPWYELLIGTIPANTWFPTPKASRGTVSSVGAIQSTSGGPPLGWYYPGTSFKSVSMPNATPALAAIVARLNPQPDLELQMSSNGNPATTGSEGLGGQPAYVYGPDANVTAWNALPLFVPDISDASFISGRTTLALFNYANFFLVNPLWMVAEVAGNSPSSGPYPIIYSAALNPAGIHRFGLRSYVRDSYWFADSALLAQQSAAAQTQTFNTLYAGLTTRCASLMTPESIMRDANCIQPLRCDIFPGCRWRFSPFRGGDTWDFYIRSVRHVWRFGGPSRTELELERGLPTTVYANTKQLQQALTGSLTYQNGVLTAISKSVGPTLQTFSSAPGSLKAALGAIAGVYSTPQAK